MSKCPICGEYVFSSRHTCGDLWWVRNFDDDGDLSKIYAKDAKEAAEKWPDAVHFFDGESPHDLTLIVWDRNMTEALKIFVEACAVIEYHANRPDTIKIDYQIGDKVEVRMGDWFKVPGPASGNVGGIVRHFIAEGDGADDEEYHGRILVGFGAWTDMHRRKHEDPQSFWLRIEDIDLVEEVKPTFPAALPPAASTAGQPEKEQEDYV